MEWYFYDRTMDEIITLKYCPLTLIFCGLQEDILKKIKVKYGSG